jgi:hypothetical protein
VELNFWVYRADNSLCFAYRDEAGNFFNEADGTPINDVLCYDRWQPSALPH